MKSIDIGQILLLLFFIVLPLLNFLLQRVKKRRSHPIPQEKRVEQTRRPEPVPLTPRTAFRPPHDSERTPQARAATPLTNNRFTKRSLLGTPRDVRRGIVVMTLLGPCRAFDPPE